jgi:hypothetical protein
VGIPDAGIGQMRRGVGKTIACDLDLAESAHIAEPKSLKPRDRYVGISKPCVDVMTGTHELPGSQSTVP